jgi:hypothetical protein
LPTQRGQGEKPCPRPPVYRGVKKEEMKVNGFSAGVK